MVAAAAAAAASTVFNENTSKERQSLSHSYFQLHSEFMMIELVRLSPAAHHVTMQPLESSARETTQELILQVSGILAPHSSSTHL